MYEKSLDTLEVLMNKMGLRESFERVLEQYEEQFKQMEGSHSLNPLLLKILTRCKIMYMSLFSI